MGPLTAHNITAPKKIGAVTPVHRLQVNFVFWPCLRQGLRCNTQSECKRQAERPVPQLPQTPAVTRSLTAALLAYYPPPHPPPTSCTPSQSSCTGHSVGVSASLCPSKHKTHNARTGIILMLLASCPLPTHYEQHLQELMRKEVLLGQQHIVWRANASLTMPGEALRC